MQPRTQGRWCGPLTARTARNVERKTHANPQTHDRRMGHGLGAWHRQWRDPFGDHDRHETDGRLAAAQAARPCLRRDDPWAYAAAAGRAAVSPGLCHLLVD